MSANLFIMRCFHGVDLTQRPCRLCAYYAPDPARYLDLDSPEAERRLAEALDTLDLDAFDGFIPHFNADYFAKSILAALRNPPTADEGESR